MIYKHRHETTDDGKLFDIVEVYGMPSEIAACHSILKEQGYISSEPTERDYSSGRCMMYYTAKKIGENHE